MRLALGPAWEAPGSCHFCNPAESRSSVCCGGGSDAEEQGRRWQSLEAKAFIVCAAEDSERVSCVSYAARQLMHAILV